MSCNLNRSFECIQTKKKNINQMEKHYCAEPCSNQSPKLNINRIKLLFLKFLKQFNIQELNFVIKFLKYLLNKYDSDIIELLGRLFKLKKNQYFLILIFEIL